MHLMPHEQTLAYPKPAVICWTLDLQRCELSHVTSSRSYLTFVSFLQDASNGL